MVLFLKKTFTWLKNYWYIPIAIVAVILFATFLGRNPNKSLIQLIEATRENYRKQIEVIEGFNREEQEKKEKLRVQYYEIIAAIDEKYEEELKQLKLSERKTVRLLLDKYKDDDEGLAKELSDKFGISYRGAVQ